MYITRETPNYPPFFLVCSNFDVTVYFHFQEKQKVKQYAIRLYSISILVICCYLFEIPNKNAKTFILFHAFQMAEDNAEDFDIEDVEAQLQAQRDQRRKLRDARARSQVLLQECDLPNMTHPLSKTVTPFLVRFPTLKVHETSPEMKDSVKNAGAFFIPKGSEVIPLTEMPFNPTVQKQPYKNLMANKRYGILENAMRIVEDGMDWTLYNYIPNEKNFKNNPNLKAAGK